MDIALNTLIGPSGLSSAGREFFKCLDGYGLRVIPMWYVPIDGNAEYAEKSLTKRMIEVSNRPLGDHIQFHVGTPHAIRLTKGRRLTLASLVHENNVLSGSQIQTASTVDVIASPSIFCRNACLSSGIPKEKIHYVPYPIDLGIWNVSVVPTYPNTNGRFRFLFMNTINERKGLDVLLRAWWQGFSSKDPIELVIKSYWQDTEVTAEEYITKIQKEMGIRTITGKAPISVIYDILPENELPGFMKSFDALVSPHRAEGFGMNPRNAMALGVPVISTEYSGTLDFANRDTAWTIKVDKLSRGSQEWMDKFKYSAITWAEPSVEHLVEQMKQCIKGQEDRRQKAELGLKLIAEKYSYSNVLSSLELALEWFSKGIWSELCSEKDLKINIPDRFKNEDVPVEMIKI